MSSTPDKRNTNCLVCSGPSNGICHFGVQCCRACASFFHRSIKERRNYTCRWDQNCRISNDHGLRNSCRACRLKKCLEMGMADEKKRDRRPYTPGESNFPSDPTTTSSAIQHEGEGKSAFANFPNIQKFVDSLRQYNHSFRAISVVEGISSELAKEQQVRLISLDEYTKMIKGSALLIYSMLCNHLPSIRQLSRENAFKLVKLFHSQFLLIVQANLTERAMIDANSPIGMLVPGGALNKDQLEHFFGPNIDEKQRESHTAIVNWHFDFCRKRYRPLLISQLEFAAITGIMFWNTVEKAHPFVPFEEIDTQREALYAELFGLITAEQQKNRRKLDGQNSAAIRFAKLLDLANQLMLHIWEMDEMFTMAKIFLHVHDFWDDISLPP